MNDNWISYPFSLPFLKNREIERDIEVAKPVLNNFFNDPINFHRKQRQKLLKNAICTKTKLVTILFSFQKNFVQFLTLLKARK